MNTGDKWKKALTGFFAERAYELGPNPDLADHCYVSGRDPRAWADRRDYDDLINSIVVQLNLTSESRILEVGCATGFIALGLAPRVSHYTGVDLAKPALAVAQSLRLPNAKFHESDGAKLPFPDNSFDAAVCHDVFINLPSWDVGESIIKEMIRVVRSGSPILIGSTPDEEKREEFEKRVTEVQAELSAKYGEAPVHKERGNRWRYLLRRILKQPTPAVGCYYYKRGQFLDCAERLNVRVDILDVHPRSPYYGMRFNARFIKP